MRAVAAWLRLDLRRRARSLVVVTVLLGLAGGLVFAVTAGARRDGSAMQRLRAESLPATAVVVPNIPGFDWDAIRALPEVAALGELPWNSTYGIEGIINNPVTNDVGFPAASPGAYVDVERGAVLEGRRLDNSKVDEAIAGEPLMRKYDLQVGDTLTARMFTPAQLDAYSQSLSVPRRVRHEDPPNDCESSASSGPRGPSSTRVTPTSGSSLPTPSSRSTGRFSSARPTTPSSTHSCACAVGSRTCSASGRTSPGSRAGTTSRSPISPRARNASPTRPPSSVTRCWSSLSLRHLRHCSSSGRRSCGTPSRRCPTSTCCVRSA